MQTALSSIEPDIKGHGRNMEFRVFTALNGIPERTSYEKVFCPAVCQASGL